MPRNGEQARGRLQQAALELFREHGFDRTTSAEIATRAGVTERTFFRHFADKRDVLFDGQAILHEKFVKAVAEDPDVGDPLQALLRVFLSAERLLVDNRPFSEPRHHVIHASSALYERELAKLAFLADALAEALRERGVPDRRAALAGQVGIAAFEQAFSWWIDDPAPGLGTHMAAAFDELRALASATAGSTSIGTD